MVKIQLFVERKSLSLKLKAVMLLLEQQIPQGTKRVRARGGKSRGRAGDWVGPSLCCPAFWLQTPACQVVMKVYLTVC